MKNLLTKVNNLDFICNIVINIKINNNMADVVINNKVKTQEEGKHTYIGNYKGKEFKISLQDENNDQEGMMRYPVEGKVCVAVYMEGEDKFTDEEKNFIFKELVEMIYEDTLEAAGDSKVYVENHYETWWKMTFEVSGTVDGKEFVMDWTDHEDGSYSDIKVGKELFEGKDAVWGKFGEVKDEYDFG